MHWKNTSVSIEHFFYQIHHLLDCKTATCPILFLCGVVLQNVMEQFNPGLRNLVNLGKNYEKSVTGNYLDAYLCVLVSALLLF